MDTVPALRRQLAEALVERDQLAADVEALCISQAEASTGHRKGAAAKVWNAQFLQLEERTRKAEEASLTALRDAERLNEELKGHKSALGQLQTKLRDEMRAGEDLKGEVKFYMKRASSALADRDAEAAEAQSLREHMASSRRENARLTRDLQQAEAALSTAEREFTLTLTAEKRRADEATAELAERGTQAETSAKLTAARTQADAAAADAKAARREAAAARESADLVKRELEVTRAKLHATLGNGGNENGNGSKTKGGSGSKDGSDGGGSFFRRLRAGVGTGGSRGGGGGGEDYGEEVDGGLGIGIGGDGGGGGGNEGPLPPMSDEMTALLLEEASRLKAQVEAADEARDDVVRQLSQATKEKLEALVELAQESERRRRDAATIDQLQRQCAGLQKKLDGFFAATASRKKQASSPPRISSGGGGGGGGGGTAGATTITDDDGASSVFGAGATGDSDRSQGSSDVRSPGTPTRSGSFIGRMFGVKGGSYHTPGSSAQRFTRAQAERKIAELTSELAAVRAELDRVERIAASAASLRAMLVPSDAAADIVAATDAEPSGGDEAQSGRSTDEVVMGKGKGKGREQDSGLIWDAAVGREGQTVRNGPRAPSDASDGETGTFTSAADDADAAAAAAAAHRRGDAIQRAGYVAEEARLLRITLLGSSDNDDDNDDRGGRGAGAGGSSASASASASETGSLRSASTIPHLHPLPAAAAAASCVEMAELAYLAARLQERCGRAERELAKAATRTTGGGGSLKGADNAAGLSPRGQNSASQKYAASQPYYPPA